MNHLTYHKSKIGLLFFLPVGFDETAVVFADDLGVLVAVFDAGLVEAVVDVVNDPVVVCVVPVCIYDTRIKSHQFLFFFLLGQLGFEH